MSNVIVKGTGRSSNVVFFLDKVLKESIFLFTTAAVAVLFSSSNMQLTARPHAILEIPIFKHRDQIEPLYSQTAAFLLHTDLFGFFYCIKFHCL